MRPTLRSLITERGLRQNWVADQLKVTDVSLSNWVRGSVRLPLTRIRPLAKALNVSTETIVDAAENTLRAFDAQRAAETPPLPPRQFSSQLAQS